MRPTTFFLILSTIVIITLLCTPDETSAGKLNKIKHVKRIAARKIKHKAVLIAMMPRKYKRLGFAVAFGALAAKAKKKTHIIPLPLPLPLPVPEVVEKEVVQWGPRSWPEPDGWD